MTLSEIVQNFRSSKGAQVILPLHSRVQPTINLTGTKIIDMEAFKAAIASDEQNIEPYWPEALNLSTDISTPVGKEKNTPSQ